MEYPVIMKRGGMSPRGPIGKALSPPPKPADAAWSANPNYPVWRKEVENGTEHPEVSKAVRGHIA